MLLNFVVQDAEKVEEKRGFVPSDVNDPGKREFLTQLRREYNAA